MRLLLVALLALVPLTAQGKQPAARAGWTGASTANLSKEKKPSPFRLGESRAAARREATQEAQQSLNDQGFDAGPADGVMGPRTRAGILQYQKSEDLPVTGRLDAETASQLRAGRESIAANLTGVGRDVAQGGNEIGRAAPQAREGVVEAVSLVSDRSDREEKREGSSFPHAGRAEVPRP
ncbi:MAG TPA: peptidoglycan-binding domain-containing protein [Bryobacterales bacterium]|nr:peptidoglycan-binding domain-containing protein [Bryobacterales bacterium]